jgi:hypothetical protein
MLSRCAWCNTDQGAVAPFDDKAVTHTICVACSLRILSYLREEPARTPRGRPVRALAPSSRTRRFTVARMSSRTFLAPFDSSVRAW